ncbi:hypothetical protein FVP43_10155 [Lactococcus sp. dk322]|nr:hypothetical protein FVP42_10685 [Lactococcus sp. dk310]TXK47468.1 hypothetical protein FVP43_10155 [Lactococcus sp. dk322]
MRRRNKELKGYLNNFIVFMFLGMGIYVVMDKFFENATPSEWIVTIALSVWFAYTSNITEDKK